MPATDPATLEILIKIRDELAGLNRAQAGLKSAKTSADAAQKSFFKFEAGLGQLNLGSLSLAGGMLKLAGAITAAVKAGVGQIAQLERAATRFTALGMSAETARARVAELDALARNNALDFEGVASAARLLETLTGGALTGASSMRMIGDAAAGAGIEFGTAGVEIGKFHAALQSGARAGEAAKHLAEMGLLTNEAHIQIRKLAQAGAPAAQMWAIAEKELARFNGSMDRQNRTLTNMTKIASEVGVDVMSGLLEPFTGAFKTGLETVLEYMGVLPTKIEQTVRAIEAGAQRIAKAVAIMTPDTKAQTQADAAAQYRDTLAQKNALQSQYTRAAPLQATAMRGEGYEEKIAAFDKTLNELRLQLVKFTGINAELVGMTAEQVDNRIAELETLRDSTVTRERGAFEGKFANTQTQRGFQGGEANEYNLLTTLRANAGTADQIANQNQSAKEQDALAKEIAATYERITATLDGHTKKHAELLATDEWLNATAQTRLTLLDREDAAALAAIEKQYALADAANDAATADAIKHRALEDYDAALITNAARRKEVENQVTGEKQKQIKAANDLAEKEEDRLANRIRIERELAANNPDLTNAQRQDILNDLRRRELELLDQKIERLQKLAPLVTDPVEKKGVENQIAALEGEKEIAGLGTPPKKRAIDDARSAYDASHDGTQLTAGEGIEAGVYAAANSLGTAGDALSDFTSGALLDSVNAISEGIHGWITGTESFGDVLRNLGDQIFRELLDTIIRIGVQWLVNTILVKTGLASIAATEDGIRTTRTAKNIAAETAQTPSKTMNAAASGISSFGMALIFGALAIALILAAASAFETGGPVRGGEQFIRVNERGPEYVINAAARARYGDALLASINAGAYDPELAGAPPSLSSASPSSSSSAPNITQRFFIDRESLRQDILNSGDFADTVTDILRQNAWRLG